MVAVYPGAIKDFPTRYDLTQSALASHVNDIQDEVTAIQQALGVDPHVGPGRGSTLTRYNTLGQRVTREGSPSAVVEAHAQAPYDYVYPTVGGGPRQNELIPHVVWGVVRTRVDGAAIDEVVVEDLALPSARGYLTSLYAGGVAADSGTCTIDLLGTVRRPRAGYDAIVTPGALVSAVRLEHTTTSLSYETYQGGVYKRLKEPPGRGWSLIDTKYTNAFRAYGNENSTLTFTATYYWTRTVEAVYAASTSRFQMVDVTDVIASVSAPAVAGEEFALHIDDLSYLGPDATSTLVCTDVRVRGVQPPRLRLRAVSTDVGGAL